MDTEYDAALEAAIKLGDLKNVEFMCLNVKTKFATYSKPLLYLAADHNHWDVVDFFAKHANLAHHAMIVAARYNNLPFIEKLAKEHWFLNKYSAETLFAAVTNHHNDLVMYLIKAGVNFQSQASIVVHKAAESGNMPMLKFFLRSAKTSGISFAYVAKAAAEVGTFVSFEYLLKKLLAWCAHGKEDFPSLLTYPCIKGNSLPIWKLYEQTIMHWDTKTCSVRKNINSDIKPILQHNHFLKLLESSNNKNKQLLNYIFDSTNIFLVSYENHNPGFKHPSVRYLYYLMYCLKNKLFDTASHLFYSYIATKRARLSHINLNCCEYFTYADADLDYTHLIKAIQTDTLTRHSITKHAFLKFTLKPISLKMQMMFF
jgi:hypothetical protein